MSKPVRVLVVDDSTFVRRAIVRMLQAAGGFDVVAQAADGDEAIEAIRTLPVDVVTLDVVMPGTDGVEVLRRIMRTKPIPVVMLSTQTAENAEVTFECLDAGAVDFVQKPQVYTHMNMPVIADELVDKLRAAAGVQTSSLLHEARSASVSPAASECTCATAGDYDALIVGCSTGGPPALTKLLRALPAGYPLGVAIVQHMPVGFTAALAQRLDAQSAIEVKEARDGDIFKPGRVLLAKAGEHLRFESRGAQVVVRCSPRGPRVAHVPSVDVMMGSAADTFGPRAAGVLMTGMGADGAEGLLAMRRAGGLTIAEDESTAVIYGMPRAAAELGAACEVLPLDDIARRAAGLGGA